MGFLVMKKSVIMLTACLFVVLYGCRHTKEVSYYPSEEKDASEQADDTGKNTEKLDYIIYGSDEKSAYEVKARKIGDLDSDYPVYEVLPRDITDEDIKEYVTQIFDAGSANVVLPYFLTQSDYVEQRITMMEARKEQCIAQNEEVLPYIDNDLENLYDRQESPNLNANYTIPYENIPKWIDMHDFYESEMQSDVQCRFCFVEGTIEGVYYRLEFTDYHNSIMIRLMRLQDYFEGSNTIFRMNDEKHLPFNKNNCGITPEEAQSQAEAFLGKWNIQGYAPIAEFPAAVYGELKDGGQYPDNTESGYICYFARQVNGKTRLFTTDIENFDYLIASYDNLLSLPYYEEQDWTTPTEISEGTGIFRLGYEYLCVCVTARGVTDCFWNSPSDVGEIKTEKTEMLAFDKIDSCAQQYLKYKAGTDDYEYYFIPSIDRIELGMCRVTKDNTHYYMVPAWYYYIHSDQIAVEQITAAIVNAIDGSIIDIKRGGNTITFKE